MKLGPFRGKRSASSPESFHSFAQQILGKPKPRSTLLRESQIFAEGLPDRSSYLTERQFRTAMRRYHDSNVKRLKMLEASQEIREAHSHLIKQLKRRRLIHSTSQVASLGSGSGVLENYIGKFVCPKGNVTGVDFSHNLNLFAKNTAEKIKAQNVRFVEGDINQLPIAKKSQDLVIVSGPYHFDERVYQEAKRVLRDENSHLVIDSMNFPEFVNPLKRMLQKAGFELEFQESLDIPNFPSIVLSFKKRR